MVEHLMLFGLSRQEATIYICLYQNGALNGYEVAKITGISRSNVYSTLSSLVEKAAAYLMEGASNKYMAVALDDLHFTRVRQMEEAKKYLDAQLKPAKTGTEGYITIEGYRNITDKIYNMLSKVEKRIYLSLSNAYLGKLSEDLILLSKQNKKVVVLTDEPVDLPGCQIYLYENKESYHQIHLIVDSSLVLTGEISGSDHDTCLYSGQKNFVNVLKEAMSNEIKLIELKDKVYEM